MFTYYPRTTRPHRNLKDVYPLCSRFAKSPSQSPDQSPSLQISLQVSLSKSPSQSFSFVQLVFWLNLIRIQQVGLTILYLPSS